MGVALPEIGESGLECQQDVEKLTGTIGVALHDSMVADRAWLGPRIAKR